MSSDQRRRELATIHLAKKQLGLDDETYRDILWTVARVRSASELDSYGRGRVIAHLKSRGFRPKRSRKKDPERRYPGHPGDVAAGRSEMVGKIEALLADMTLPWSYADAMAKRMYQVDSVRFLESKQLRGIITALVMTQRKLADREDPHGH